MIIGAHTIVYSQNPEADRALLRDVLRLSFVDSGDGWLIFALPPSEVAIHPADVNDKHELYLLCDDVAAFVDEMTARDIVCAPVQDRGWGLLTELTLPGGGKLGVYEARHARPAASGGETRTRTKTKSKTKAKSKSRAKTKATAKIKTKAKGAQRKAKPKARRR
jgi:hypothetical protein